MVDGISSEQLAKSEIDKALSSCRWSVVAGVCDEMIDEGYEEFF